MLWWSSRILERRRTIQGSRHQHSLTSVANSSLTNPTSLPGRLQTLLLRNEAEISVAATIPQASMQEETAQIIIRSKRISVTTNSMSSGLVLRQKNAASISNLSLVLIIKVKRKVALYSRVIKVCVKLSTPKWVTVPALSTCNMVALPSLLRKWSIVTGVVWSKIDLELPRARTCST